MSNPYILAIDEGTTNAKAVVIDDNAQILTKASAHVSLSHPQPGWAEQDPEEIFSAVVKVMAEALKDLPKEQLRAIAISNQRESVLAWDRVTGQALTPLVSWQCRRSVEICEQIAAKAQSSKIKQATGSLLDPLFPATKIVWLLSHLPNGYERALGGEICVGTVDSWLVWKLTAGKSFVTDYSNASRYQLFNIHTLHWDLSLLDLFHVPLNCLPEVIASTGIRGFTKNCPGIPDAVPIHSQIGDSHAAFFGQGGYQRGVVKATYGTGSSLMTLVEPQTQSDSRISMTVGWHDGQVHMALEGNITHSGAAIEYMSTLLGVNSVDKLEQMRQGCLDKHSGVFFIPALAGLGAPHWRPKAKGVIYGLTDSSTPEVLACAAFESVAYQVADLFFAMREVANIPFEKLSVDGGATKNKALMQFQADLLGVPLIKNNVSEVSALGAAYLAGFSLGWWPDYAALSKLPKSVELITPNQDSQLIQEKYSEWKQLVQRVCL